MSRYRGEVLTIRISSVLFVTACSSATAGEETPDAGTATYQRYTGRLATTAEFPFGGPPYCNYTVRLRDVEADVVFRDASLVVAMTLDDTTVEATVGSCRFPPAMPSPQVFEHRGGPWGVNLDGKIRPVLSGLDANRPKTAVSAEVSAPAAAGVEVSLRWARTDQDPTLTWIVTASLPLTPAPCTTGTAVCLGGGEGTLFSCVDGTAMGGTVMGTVLHEVMRCEAGCAASGQACN